MPKEELLYPPKVWSYNTDKARETGEAEHVDYDIYLDIVKNKKVGDVIRAYAGAPGVGYVEHRITKIDATGVYAVEVANTIYVPDGDYYR